jgi:nucleotide-binding universal stress UspA family protein
LSTKEQTEEVVMNVFPKILVPVDFSAHSDLALLTAVRLSRSEGGSLVIVYVNEPLMMPVPEGFVLFSAAQLARMFEDYQRGLTKQKQIAEAAGAIQVEVHLLHGFADREICSFAEQGAFDLIVMGTHGRRGLSHAFLGSVAERVMRMAPCPVLTVRADARARAAPTPPPL